MFQYAEEEAGLEPLWMKGVLAIKLDCMDGDGSATRGLERPCWDRSSHCEATSAICGSLTKSVPHTDLAEWSVAKTERNNTPRPRSRGPDAVRECRSGLIGAMA